MVSLRMSRVLVSGASGLIGTALVPSLEASGAAIVRLKRADSGKSPATANEIIRCDLSKAISPDAVSGFDAVIHLAGESIVGRWTAAKKTKIRDSRVVGTRN